MGEAGEISRGEGLFALGVSGVLVCDLGGLFVAEVEVEAVTQGEAAAGGYEVVAFVGIVGEFFFVVVPAEGVGGE